MRTTEQVRGCTKCGYSAVDVVRLAVLCRANSRSCLMMHFRPNKKSML